MWQRGRRGSTCRAALARAAGAPDVRAATPIPLACVYPLRRFPRRRSTFLADVPMMDKGGDAHGRKGRTAT